MIHLYALCRHRLPGTLAGIDGAPLEHLAVGDLFAIVSQHPAPLRTSPEVALTHVATIEAAAEHTDVLPVQLGRGHNDGVALHTKLDAALPGLREALDRVGGHVELVVRPVAEPASVAPPAPAPTCDEAHATGPGRAYLERQRAGHLAATEARVALRAQLADVTGPLETAAAAVHETTGRYGPERCFLVARADAPSFGRRARELVAADARFVVGGPWPPFTFAALTDDAEVVG